MRKKYLVFTFYQVIENEKAQCSVLCDDQRGGIGRRWEGRLRGKGYIHMHSWFALLWSRNCNIVKQLYCSGNQLSQANQRQEPLFLLLHWDMTVLWIFRLKNMPVSHFDNMWLKLWVTGCRKSAGKTNVSERGLGLTLKQVHVSSVLVSVYDHPYCSTPCSS